MMDNERIRKYLENPTRANLNLIETWWMDRKKIKIPDDALKSVIEKLLKGYDESSAPEFERMTPNTYGLTQISKFVKGGEKKIKQLLKEQFFHEISNTYDRIIDSYAKTGERVVLYSIKPLFELTEEPLSRNQVVRILEKAGEMKQSLDGLWDIMEKSSEKLLKSYKKLPRMINKTTFYVK